MSHNVLVHKKHDFFSKKFNKMTLLKLLWVVFGEKMIYVYWFFWKQLHLFMKITIKVAIFGEIKVVILAQPETDHHDWFLTLWFHCCRNNYVTVRRWRMTMMAKQNNELLLLSGLFLYFHLSWSERVNAKMCTHFFAPKY